MQTEPPLVPTLVVGGEHSFVLEKLTEQLRRHGLSVAHHWEWKKKPKSFPRSIERVFVVTDMVSHGMNDVAREMAHAVDVPVIFGGRKWATNKERLERAGFPERLVLPPPQEAPLEVPQETLVSDTAYHHNKTSLRNIYFGILMENPETDNKEAYEKALLRAPLQGVYAGKPRPDLLAALRKELGIVRPNNMRVTPVAVPAVDPSVAPVPAPLVVATVDTSEVPVALLEEYAQRTAAKTAPRDVRELVQLLRLAMETEGIERLVVTKDALTFRRVVIEEGSFDV
jgi:hypothetical protein